MKKLLLLSVALIAMSCSSNDSSSNSNDGVVKDCNCDRVVDASTFSVIGTPESPATNYYTSYITINDCTGIQRQKNHTSTSYPSRPQLGQCR
jgi:hypothetical protein